MQITYVIGEPGVGKSTLIGNATKGIEWFMQSRPFMHVIYEQPEVVELGPRRGEYFSGTDGLSMSVQPRVVDYLQFPTYNHVLGEGDRLANDKFFRYCDSISDFTVVLVTAADGVAGERRAKRAEKMSLPEQNEKWVKGRLTKLANLAEAWDPVVIYSDEPLSSQLAALDKLPVFERFKEFRNA